MDSWSERQKVVQGRFFHAAKIGVVFSFILTILFLFFQGYTIESILLWWVIYFGSFMTFFRGLAIWAKMYFQAAIIAAILFNIFNAVLLLQPFYKISNFDSLWVLVIPNIFLYLFLAKTQSGQKLNNSLAKLFAFKLKVGE